MEAVDGHDCVSFKASHSGTQGADCHTAKQFLCQGKGTDGMDSFWPKISSLSKDLKPRCVTDTSFDSPYTVFKCQKTYTEAPR